MCINAKIYSYNEIGEETKTRKIKQQLTNHIDEIDQNAWYEHL
jgi:hypothetical protein